MTAIALWFPNPRSCKVPLSNDLHASFSSRAARIEALTATGHEA